MAAEKFAEFIKLLGENNELKEKFESVSKDVDAVIQLGKEAGIDFTIADMKAYHDQHGDELTDEDLDCVAGGVISTVAACVGAAAAVVCAVTAVAGNLRY